MAIATTYPAAYWADQVPTGVQILANADDVPLRLGGMDHHYRVSMVVIQEPPRYQLIDYLHKLYRCPLPWLCTTFLSNALDNGIPIAWHGQVLKLQRVVGSRERVVSARSKNTYQMPLPNLYTTDGTNPVPVNRTCCHPGRTLAEAYANFWSGVGNSDGFNPVTWAPRCE